MRIPVNNSIIERWNRMLILRTISREDIISQIALVRQTGLSPGTITNIMKKLRREGFITELGLGESSGGRKPVLFRFNGQSRAVACLTISAGTLHIGILDLAGKILDETTLATATSDPEALVALAADMLEAALGRAGLSHAQLTALTILGDGILDPEGGWVIYASNLGWRNVPICAKVQERIALPVFLERTTSARTLGEWWTGAARGVGNLVGLNIDTGIGATQVIDGHVYHGASGMEGEIGHTRFVASGRRCSCGRHGCLETVASAGAIVRYAERHSLPLPPGDAHRQLEEIARLAAAGNEHAVAAFREAGEYAGDAVAQIINYTDPDRIVLTGCVVEADPGPFFDAVQARAGASILATDLRTPSIVRGALGSAGVLIGGAIPGFQHFFDNPAPV